MLYAGSFYSLVCVGAMWASSQLAKAEQISSCSWWKQIIGTATVAAMAGENMAPAKGRPVVKDFFEPHMSSETRSP